MESEVTKSGQKKRSFANGLVIEELAMGKPDGKRATKGKKVVSCFSFSRTFISVNCYCFLNFRILAIVAELAIAAE